MASHLGSEQIKQLSENTNFQDGDSRDNTLADPEKQSTGDSFKSGMPGRESNVPDRSTNCHRKSSTFGQVTHEAHTMAFEEQLESTGNSGENHLHPKVTPHTFRVVAGGKQCDHGTTPTPTSTCVTSLTDASKEGWGAHLNEHMARGSWSLPESKLDIDYLELKAALLVLKEFQSLCTSKVVLIATDNTTVVAYINKEGGMKSGPCVPCYGGY